MQIFTMSNNRIVDRSDQFDEKGADTLDVMAQASAFNQWMYDTIKNHCKGRILEIGSGIGTISQFFLKDHLDIYVSDIQRQYRDHLHELLRVHKRDQKPCEINLVDDHFDDQHTDRFGTFDTVFALNVIEHIENDDLAIFNATKLLKPGGQLIILVPSYNFLYNQLDTALSHYRRYTTSSLGELFSKHDLQIKHKQYFNLAGIPSWFISGKILGNSLIPSSQLGLFNKMVPVFKLLDRIVFNKVGLSTIIVGQK